MPIIDAHAHAFPDAIAPHALKVLIAEALWQPVQAYHDGTVAGLLASMDRAGIQQTVLCSVATKPAQVRKITDWSAAIASERIIPFASIHPDYDQPEAEVERIAGLGLRGLKFHPQYMQCPCDDPRLVRIARAAAKANLALVLHAGYDLAFTKTDLGAPRRIRALHEAVPDLRLLACHLGGWEDWEESLAHVAGQRIFIETSYCLGQCPPDLMSRILAKHPPDYLVFGTDAPWADQQAELAAFRALPLPPGVIEQALWANGRRFTGLSPA